jgi:hypothetical protein
MVAKGGEVLSVVGVRKNERDGGYKEDDDERVGN